MVLFARKNLLWRSSILILAFLNSMWVEGQIKENSTISVQLNGGYGFLSKRYEEPPCVVTLGNCMNKYYMLKSEYVYNISGYYDVKPNSLSPFSFYTGIESYFHRVRIGLTPGLEAELDSLYPGAKADSTIRHKIYISLPIGIRYNIGGNFSFMFNLTYHFGEWIKDYDYDDGNYFGEYGFFLKSSLFHYNLGVEYLMKEKHGFSFRMQKPFRFDFDSRSYKTILQIGYRYCF